MKYHKTFLPPPPRPNLQLGTISMNLSDTDTVFINDVVAEDYSLSSPLCFYSLLRLLFQLQFDIVFFISLIEDTLY